MTRSAAEVEAEVEASRTELDRNMEALKSKMTPGQMFDEAARMAGSTGQQVAAKFVEQAKANPMPLAVMGLGLAWLMASSNKQSTSSSYGAYGEPRSYAAETGYGGGWDGVSSGQGGSHGGAMAGLKDKVQGVGEKASDMISGARDKLSSGASSVGDTSRTAVHNAAQGLSSAAASVKDKAGQVGHQAQRTFLDTLESEPLLIAGLGLIVGAAIGAALPSTSAEDRVMGQTRDKILDKGKDVAQTGLQQASSAVQAAYGSVKDELKQGGDGRELADRVESAARSGVQAARDELQSGAPH